jgi:multisubunit Na+/H+ antiporter MnhE subunit
MSNIFNLFLFLFFTWALFMVASGNISWGFALFGILASIMVAFFSFKLNIIKEDSEFLYFNFGFYRHFLAIYLKNLAEFPEFLMNLAFGSKVHPIIYEMPIENIDKSKIAILIASLDMSCGLLAVDFNDKKLAIHAINKEYLEKIDIEKITRSLSNVNDDNLI